MKGIYLITTNDERAYVGQAKDVYGRWKEHKNNLRLDNAISTDSMYHQWPLLSYYNKNKCDECDSYKYSRSGSYMRGFRDNDGAKFCEHTGLKFHLLQECDDLDYWESWWMQRINPSMNIAEPEWLLPPYVGKTGIRTHYGNILLKLSDEMRLKYTTPMMDAWRTLVAGADNTKRAVLFLLPVLRNPPKDLYPSWYLQKYFTSDIDLVVDQCYVELCEIVNKSVRSL